MTTEQTEAPEWGAPTPPPPDRKKWTAKRTIVAVAIAVGIAAAGGAAIYAASGSVTAGEGGPGGARGGVMIGGPMGSMEGADHGQFQTGEVTEVSDTSITAKSEDGYTETYKVDSDTMKSGEVAKGDKVTIIADADGAAMSIMKDGDMMQRRGGGAPPNGGPPDDNGGPQNGDGGTRNGN